MRIMDHDKVADYHLNSTILNSNTKLSVEYFGLDCVGSKITLQDYNIDSNTIMIHFLVNNVLQSLFAF